MLHQLRLVVSFSHYLQGFVHPRWCSPDFWTINSISVKTAIFLEGFTVNHVRGDHDYTFDGLPLDIQTHGEDRYEWTPIHISWDEKLFGVQSSHLQATGMTRGWLGCLGSGFHENVFFCEGYCCWGMNDFCWPSETGATLSFPRFFSKTSGILPASLKIPFDPKNGGHQQTLKRLGSGNSNISMFIPMWGNDPIWWAYFFRWAGWTTN